MCGTHKSAFTHAGTNTLIQSNDPYNSCISLIITSVNVFKVFELKWLVVGWHTIWENYTVGIFVLRQH